jgi:peptidoglycan hydrolase-like protein with peptidoglycan-binding domain
MTKVRNVATLLALCGAAALPACSMFGGGNQNSRASYPTYAAAPTYAAPQQSAVSPDMIRQVQGNLQQQGLYHGSVDGVWGPGTESAVRSYQQQHNLNTTGQLDASTLSSMNIAANQNYGNSQPPPNDQRYGSNYNPPNNNQPNYNPPPPDNANPPNPNNPR